MRQTTLLSIVALLAIGFTGCGTAQDASSGDQSADGDGDVVVAVDGSDDVDVTVDGDGEPLADGESAEVGNAFTDPTVAGGPPVGAVPLDLITSTNPDTRAQQVQRDRPDPFSLLPTAPTVEVRETATRPGSQRPGAQSTAAASSGNNSSGNNSSGSNPSGSNAQSQSGSGSGASPDGTAAGSAEPQGPPPPPPTTTARAVAVSGVVQIGSVPYAIVHAPNESSSRYVRAGQSLSNGAVLVKRIESYPGSEPVVVLEQNGVEVVRGVEGGRPSDDEDATETANAGEETLG